MHSVQERIQLGDARGEYLIAKRFVNVNNEEHLSDGVHKKFINFLFNFILYTNLYYLYP